MQRIENTLIDVYDAWQDKTLHMHTGRAIYCMTNYPERFLSLIDKKRKFSMTNTKTSQNKKPSSKGKSNYEQITRGSSRRKGVQNFADFAGESLHKRFDQMLDETIYIVKLELLNSDSYGEGYKVHFKDLPNAKDTYTASCFGAYVVPQLDNLYKMTNEGTGISLDSPIRTTIRKAGNTYHFE